MLVPRDEAHARLKLCFVQPLTCWKLRTGHNNVIVRYASITMQFMILPFEYYFKIIIKWPFICIHLPSFIKLFCSRLFCRCK